VDEWNLSSKHEEENYYRCEYYADAARLMICHPNQSKYIIDGMLQVCESICLALLNACGISGHNSTDISFDDAAAKCEGAWEGFRSSKSGQNDMMMKVVPDIQMCLVFKEPNPEDIENYILHAGKRNPDGVCTLNNEDLATAVVAITLTAFCCCCCCCFGGCYLLRRAANQREEHTKPTAPLGPTAIAWPEKGPAVSAVQTPTPSVPVQAGTVTDEEVRATAMAAPTSTPSAETLSFFERKASDTPGLAFDQQMDLRGIEFRLTLGDITQEEFEARKNEILSQK
jgi:hypothetical protein